MRHYVSFFRAFTYFRSAERALPMQKQLNSITIAKGKAVTIEIVCNAASPPVTSSTSASAAWMIPQITFLELSGLRLPSDENIDRTKIAESALVIKKIWRFWQ